MILTYNHSNFKGVAEVFSDSFSITIRFVTPFYTTEFIRKNKEVELVSSVEVKVSGKRAYTIRP